MHDRKTNRYRPNPARISENKEDNAWNDEKPDDGQKQQIDDTDECPLDDLLFVRLQGRTVSGPQISVNETSTLGVANRVRRVRRRGPGLIIAGF